MWQVHGEWGSSLHAKQNLVPQEHSGSQYCSPSTRMARPQCGTLGHHCTCELSSMYDSSRLRSYRASTSGSSPMSAFTWTGNDNGLTKGNNNYRNNKNEYTFQCRG